MVAPLVVAGLTMLAVGAWLGVPVPAGLPALAAVGGVASFFGALGAAAIGRWRGRPVRLGALGVAAAAAIAGGAWIAWAPSAPAVIVLVVDCLRADRYTPGRMPRVARRLADGVLFTQARSQSSWTRSAMPSLLSGRYPAEHGLYRTRPPDRIRDEVPMLAERFRDAGWLTAAFAEQAQLDRAFGYGRGFGRYGWRDGKAPRLNPRFLAWNTVFRSTPRFVLLHYIDVHGPYRPGRAFLPPGLPASSLATAPSAKWRATIKAIRSGEIVPTPDDWAHLAGLYDGEVRQLDARLGPMLDRLHADGTLDAAWLVFTADHGERFGEHGDIEHMGAPDETVLAVPLVIRPPGGGSARAVTEVVQHVDVAPTLLAAAGLGPDPDLPGRDLGPAIAGGALPAAPSFAEEWYGRVHRVAVREGDWKLIRDPSPRLYDLAADPLETTDLAAARPEVVARLEGLLAGYFGAAEAGRPIAGVDWAAAAASGAVWTAKDAASGASATPSAETMEALEALGYLE